MLNFWNYNKIIITYLLLLKIMNLIIIKNTCIKVNNNYAYSLLFTLLFYKLLKRNYLFKYIYM